MRKAPVFALCLTAALAWSASAVAEDPTQQLLAYKDRVAKATVLLPEKMCAGSVAGDREHVVTAAHCVTEGATRVRVKFSQGSSQVSNVEFIDRDADLALLKLDQPVAIEPLKIAGDLPRRGERLLFVGRTDRPSKTQVARVERLGRCPSLPGQPQSLFTSVQARPGDSGAPLVDSELQVVGVIHGGSSCHIAAPTVRLARELAAPGATAKSAPQQPKIADQDDDENDGWFFERTPNGFRFRWNFRWSIGS